MKIIYRICLQITVNLIILMPLSVSAQLRFDYEYTKLDTTMYIATYNLKYVRDTSNVDFVRNVDMLLFIGENISVFIEKENFKADTIARKFKNSNDLQQSMRDPEAPMPKFFYHIYKNYPKGKLTFTEHMIGGTFKFEENLDLFNWNVEEDTMTIAGYKAQKATCDFGGRSWIAWFSTDIPFNDGPYKFNGLPGLILNVGDIQNHYVFDFISIHRPETKIIIDIKEKDYIECTKPEFFRAKDNFREDIIARAKEAGLSSKSQQAAAKSMSKRNNPIELQRE